MAAWKFGHERDNGYRELEVTGRDVVAFGHGSYRTAVFGQARGRGGNTVGNGEWGTGNGEWETVAL